jgi:hypothetical protein
MKSFFMSDPFRGERQAELIEEACSLRRARTTLLCPWRAPETSEPVSENEEHSLDTLGVEHIDRRHHLRGG